MEGVSKKIWLVLSDKRLRSLISMAKSNLKLVVGTITSLSNIKAMTSKWGDDDTD